jgi:hypothetical protein
MACMVVTTILKFSLQRELLPHHCQ